MPNTKSAKKALRQSEKRTVLNLRYKRKYKGLVKDLRQAISDSQVDRAKEMLPLTYKALDKAVKHGTIKRNTADRHKSRLTLLVNKQGGN